MFSKLSPNNRAIYFDKNKPAKQLVAEQATSADSTFIVGERLPFGVVSQFEPTHDLAAACYVATDLAVDYANTGDFDLIPGVEVVNGHGETLFSAHMLEGSTDIVLVTHTELEI